MDSSRPEERRPDAGVPTNRRRDDLTERVRLVDEIKRSADGLLQDGADRGDVKLIARALAELRTAFAMLSKYRHRRKVTVFGSARTPEDDPVYQHAVAFGQAIAKAGYMVITGAGGGIMEAGHVGAGAPESIGINIMLPFEQEANRIIVGDPKLVSLRYFFTRKLLFIKETHAIVLFPGGFGTLDEGFETLTMMQTGKSELKPIVMVDQPSGTYWSRFDHYVRDELFEPGLVSEEDLSLYFVTTSIDEAVEHIQHFYRIYHSQRYVRGKLVIRLQKLISPELIERLNDEFQDILVSGKIRLGDAHHHESNEEDLNHLPRLFVPFDKRGYGRLRQMIDLINDVG
ncbi:LOG family protein [bacterium]|nr:LOG family protein [bacterium]